MKNMINESDKLKNINLQDNKDFIKADNSLNKVENNSEEKLKLDVENEKNPHIESTFATVNKDYIGMINNNEEKQTKKQEEEEDEEKIIVRTPSGKIDYIKKKKKVEKKKEIIIFDKLLNVFSNYLFDMISLIILIYFTKPLALFIFDIYRKVLGQFMVQQYKIFLNSTHLVIPSIMETAEWQEAAQCIGYCIYYLEFFFILIVLLCIYMIKLFKNFSILGIFFIINFFLHTIIVLYLLKEPTVFVNFLDILSRIGVMDSIFIDIGPVEELVAMSISTYMHLIRDLLSNYHISYMLTNLIISILFLIYVNFKSKNLDITPILRVIRISLILLYVFFFYFIPLPYYLLFLLLFCLIILYIEIVYIFKK